MRVSTGWYGIPCGLKYPFAESWILLYIVRKRCAYSPPVTAAAAESVAPQVHGDLGSPAGLTLPAGVAAPAQVVTTVLARGTGDSVRAGDLVGQYAGVDWMGTSVGSSWQAGTPEVIPVSPDVPTL